MHKFVRNLLTEWRKLELPFADATIVAGVSGGADSMSLALALHELTRRKKIDLRIVIAHLNHKLRGRVSDTDEVFVRTHAKQLGFEFVSASAKLSAKGNLEQNARRTRYSFLTKTAKASGAFAVLTAHTMDDQAETLLLNLVRGSGPDGLSAMPVVRNLDGDLLLVRPLLPWARRKDTVEFCRHMDVDYRQDTMNDDESYTRVRLRQTILPILSELNPKIVETLAHTADLLRDQPDGQGDEPATEPDLKWLKSLKRRDLYLQLRSWLRQMRGNLRSLELKHIEAIERLILSPKSGKTVELPGGGRVVKGGGRLRFDNIKVEK
jgi:tRNA(Ile)-lysidine synthase